MVISAKLFADPAAVPTAEQERAFFTWLQYGNGVYKTTSDHRLDEVNAFVAEQWRKLKTSPREILDVGASSAISSAEWADQLSDDGFDARITALDASLFGRLVRLSPVHEVLIDDAGNVLQHLLVGRPARPWRRRRDYLTGYWLVRRILNSSARRKLRRLESGAGSSVMLVSPRARNHPRVDFVQGDILKSPDKSLLGRFGAIRAANILNRGYFGNSDIAQAIANLRLCLTGVGSFLIAARTWEDGSNHATLFKVGQAHRFEVLARLREGSEIEDLVLAA
jgi:hypothetical protein